MATRLFLVRHGEIELAARDLFYGHLDVGLSVAGQHQAEAVAKALAGVELDAVYSSDLHRALFGAHLIAESRGIDVSADPAFREMSLGVLEGRRRDEPHEHHPDKLGKRYEDMVDFAFPGGENFRQVARRVEPALEASLSRHAGRSVVLVAHNSVNRIVIGGALGIPLEGVFGFRQRFGCINCIVFDADASPTARLKLLNWTPDGPLGRR